MNAIFIYSMFMSMYLYQLHLVKIVTVFFFILINIFSIFFAFATIIVTATAISSLHIVQDLDTRLHYLTNSIGLIAFCGALWLISSWVGIFAAVTTFFSLRDLFKQAANGSLMVYLFLMIILLIFEVIGAMVVFSIRNDLQENFGDFYLEMLQNGLSGNENNQNFEIALDNLQNYFSCCGYDGPEDYSTTAFGVYGRLVQSCCGLTQNSFIQCYQMSPRVFNVGCRNQIEDLINNHYTEVGTIGLCFVLVELLSISLSTGLLYLVYKEDYGCFYSKIF